EGNSNNTIPWWSGSATYMQVHDAGDLATVFPVPVVIIKGLSFRKDGAITSSIVGRAMDVQITIGSTPTTPATASTTFAAILGSSPIVVLNYTNISLPPLNPVGSPNPQGWYFPFASPYVYVIALGNLCWEMRIKNSTSSAVAPCDAYSGSS